MSGEEQDPRAEEVEAAADAPSTDPISEHLAEKTGGDPDLVQDIPAGHGGADSGASEVVQVDPDSGAAIADVSTHNDEPGIGTRRSGD